MDEKGVSRHARQTGLPQGGIRYPHPPLRSSGSVTALLIDKGHLSPAGLTRTPAIHPCRSCRAHCLAAIDSSGLDTWLDPTELNARGELNALLDNRPTYSLYARQQLVRRNHHWIANYPAGATDRPAYAAHRCHQPVPASWAAPKPPTPQPPTEVPF